LKNWTYPCHLTPFHFVSLASLSVPLTKCNAIWHLSSIHCGDLWTIQDLSVGQSLWWWSMIKERLVNLTSSKFPAFHIFYNLLELATLKEEMSFLYFGKSDINFTFAYTRYLKMIKVLKCTLEFIVVLELLHPYPLFESL